MVGFLKIDDLKSWQRMSCIIAVFGGLQFIIITFVAMFFYPDGYSFTEDYFSNLGTTVNMNTGSTNTISSALFIIACVVAGVSLIPFWVIIMNTFKETNLMRYLSIFGSIIGIISSPLLMGIGLFPADTNRFEHTFSARYFFLLFSAAILIYSIAILLKEDYHNTYAFVGFAFSILIVLYIFRFFAIINPLMQKIIVYGFIIWSALQITNIWKDLPS